MMQQQGHILQSEKAGLKRLHSTWFQLYDILEEEKWWEYKTHKYRSVII